MDHSDYLIAKFFILVAIVFVVNFVYSLITGSSIEQVRLDKEKAQKNSPDQ